MANDLSDKLVIGVASSALFDLTESDALFHREGAEAYRIHQERHVDDPLSPGVAFSFIRRLLALNDLSADNPPVEVIIMSRNSPETGLRVMRSVANHGLPISRAIFTEGSPSYAYVPAFNTALFLSADEASVRAAIDKGMPAGQVLGSALSEEDESDELRIAFDFDGVIASDEAERVFHTSGLDSFQSHEASKSALPITPGPLHQFLVALHHIQDLEEQRARQDSTYTRRLHVSVVTARSAPAHERTVASLKSWGVRVNSAFFLGGLDKAATLETLRPHIFFDDQLRHLALTKASTPSVHVPYGVKNNPGDSLNARV